MKGHGEGHGRKQPEVAPWGHANQRLVLRQALNDKNKRNYESNSSFTWCWNNWKFEIIQCNILFVCMELCVGRYSRFHSKSHKRCPHFDLKGS